MGSPDSKLVLLHNSFDEKVYVWNAHTRERLWTAPGTADQIAEFSPDGRFVVTKFWMSPIILRHAFTGDEVEVLEPDRPGDVWIAATFSANSKRLVTFAWFDGLQWVKGTQKLVPKKRTWVHVWNVA